MPCWAAVIFNSINPLYSYKVSFYKNTLLRLQSFFHPNLSFFKIYKQCCHYYQECGYLDTYDYVKYLIAFARLNQKLYILVNGFLQDLPQALNIQDQDLASLCPPCSSLSPLSF